MTFRLLSKSTYRPLEVDGELDDLLLVGVPVEGQESFSEGALQARVDRSLEVRQVV